MNGPRPKSRLAPAMIVAGATLFCPLAAYVAGYFLLGEADNQPGVRIRNFEHNWLVAIYGPMGWLEAKTTGDTTGLVGKYLNEMSVYAP